MKVSNPTGRGVFVPGQRVVPAGAGPVTVKRTRAVQFLLQAGALREHQEKAAATSGGDQAKQTKEEGDS